MDLPEFDAALHAHFPHVSIMRQRPMLGSALLPLAPVVNAPALTFERRGADTYEVNEGLSRALYLVAWCSDLPVAPPSASLYVETSQIEARAAEQAQQMERLRVDVARLNAEAATVRAEAAEQVGALRQEVVRMDAELAAAKMLAAAQASKEDALRQEAARLSTELTAAKEEVAAQVQALLLQVQQEQEDARRLRAEVAAAEARTAEAVRQEADRLTSAWASERHHILTNKHDCERLLNAERQEAVRARHDVEAIASRLHNIEQSTIWRGSAPLRNVLSTMPGLRRLGRRGLRVAWWTVTLQLRRRLRQRRLDLIRIEQNRIEQAQAQRSLAAEAGLHVLVTAETAMPAIKPEPMVALPTPPPAQPAVQPVKRTVTAVEERVQRRALGALLPKPRLSVAIGVVTYNNGESELARLLGSAHLALSRAGGPGRILVLDNGEPSQLPEGVERLESGGNVGFGAAHNRLMEAAFADGADIYIATNPDGAFHPDCIAAIARMHVAHGGQALIEACQFPVEHPKSYDPVTFETEWASGACLAISRDLYGKIGGFDDVFFMYCEDVDLSWRARAAGYAVLINPAALFLHAVTNRSHSDRMWRMMVESGNILARKWGNKEFAAWTQDKLAEVGAEVPTAEPELVPADWQDIPDFSRHFSFSPVRW
ncbi:hypothetical protein ACFQU7_12125 [Pseudoroseomonas wenyumeiae]